MERLGFYGKAILDLPDHVETPWKKEFGFDILGREDAGDAREVQIKSKD